MADGMDVAAFNIHAELYENEFGELAIRFEGDKVYRGMQVAGEARFQEDAQRFIEEGEIPSDWREMPPHELLYGRGWHHVGSMGFLDGDVNRPALELQVNPSELGEAARHYLADAIRQ